MISMAAKNPKAIRVAMLCHGYFPVVGGAERQITSLSQELVKRNVEVYVITRRYSKLPTVEILSGVNIHRIPAPPPKPIASIYYTANALHLIRQIKPDVIHAHELFSPATTAMIAQLFYKTPVIATIHGGGEIDRLQQKMLGNSRIRYFCSNIEQFVTIDHDIDLKLTDLGVPAQHRSFIPNGVDIHHFFPIDIYQKKEIKAKLNLPMGPVIIFSGRLVSLKRVDQLITAWSDIQRAFPTATLLILGAGPEEDALKKLASEIYLLSEIPQSNPDNGIRFLGEIQDVAPYLQAADLFVLPSSREGLSVAILEAMACGLAVIATDVGGNADLIEHQKTGWLIKENQDIPLSVQLSESIKVLLQDDALRSILAAAGRDKVMDSFSLDHVTDSLYKLYLDILSAEKKESTGNTWEGRK